MMTVAAKICVNLALVAWLGFLGLALATALASWLNFALLMRSLKGRLGGKWAWRGLLVYGRIALASVAMSVLSLGAFRLVQNVLPGRTAFTLATQLFSAILVGIATFLPLLRILRVDDLGEISDMIRQRLSRGSA
jgi:putative peptidoglycan lipid II flippase